MDVEHQLLAEGIEKNRELLISIKDELVQEISTMKLVQQKLKFMIYGVAIGCLILTGKLELIPAMMGM